MVDIQTCEVGAMHAALNVGTEMQFWNRCFKKYSVFVKVIFCRMSNNIAAAWNLYLAFGLDQGVWNLVWKQILNTHTGYVWDI